MENHPADSTVLKTEKTTKETKRDEKIEIKILSKYDQIKKLLSKYPKEMTDEDTLHQGIVVIEYDSFGKGSLTLNQFLKNVKDHKDCAIVICQYTVGAEGIRFFIMFPTKQEVLL